MSDSNNQNQGNGQNDGQMQAQPMPVVIHAQYLKDLSFENPNAPDSLRKGQAAPEIDMNISMDAKKLEDENIDSLYEVVLNLNVSAVREGKTAFIAEIVYAATVSMGEVNENRHHTLLLMEVPRLLFPFARQILANMTGSGGFPPLVLNPVDFRAMYINKFGRAPNQEPREDLAKEDAS